MIADNLWQTWHGMEKLLKLGTVRQIGICNFAPGELFRLLRSAKHRPDVHQMELHPYLQQRWWVEWHKSQGITVTGYSPLGNMNPVYEGRSVEQGDRRDPHVSCGDEFKDDIAAARKEYGDVDEQAPRGRPNVYPSPPPLLNNTVVKNIAKRRGCTPAQIALAWGLKRGHVVIPKSSHVDYIRENWAAIECVSQLDFQDMKELEWVGERWLHRFNNPAKTWGVRLFEGLDGSVPKHALIEDEGRDW
jgi:alcohol dehydrogenase (NADP+)